MRNSRRSFLMGLMALPAVAVLPSVVEHKSSLAPVESYESRYTFDNFVSGRSNWYAKAVCRAAAKYPGQHGPLYITGPCGTGATHLMHAVGNRIRENSGARVCYVPAERFFNECISSVRNDEVEKFRLRYSADCDVLLVDGVQLLTRGEMTQEVFRHVLDYHSAKGNQVVVTADRLPKDIRHLHEPIRSRFEAGMMAELRMPGVETRLEILLRKHRVDLDRPSAELIALVSQRSVRELEGNLKKVLMYSGITGVPVSLEMVREVLG